MDSMHLATGTGSWPGAGAAAEGREVTAHPVGFTWGDPAGTFLQPGWFTLLMTAESERGNDPNEAAMDTAVLHLNAFRPLEQREAASTRRGCWVN